MTTNYKNRLKESEGKRCVLHLKNGFRYSGIILNSDERWLEILEQTVNNIKLIAIDEIVDMEIFGEGKLYKGMPGWKALGFNSYKKYLESDFWKEKKEWILQVLGNKCSKCGSERLLEVHHLNYLSIGNEGVDDVIILCKSCHTKEYEDKIRRNQ